MKKAFLFSGLGADERVFGYLDLPDIEKIPIKWVRPKAHESLSDYAKRIIEEQININPEDTLILIGVSFGGMMAAEVAKYLKPDKLIIVSSIKTQSEMPKSFRLARFIPEDKPLPSFMLNKPNFISYYLFGVKNVTHRNLIDIILKETDEVFFKWAVKEIAFWKNEEVNTQIIHIHGTKDRIMPFRLVKNAIKIIGGGHSIVVTHAQEVSRIINENIGSS